MGRVFDMFAQITSDEPQNFLDNFIQKLNDVKKIGFSHDTQKILDNFYTLISRKHLSVTTGSSVLYKRIGKNEPVNDIDIFINGESFFKEINQYSTLKEFFDSTELREAFQRLDSEIKPTNNIPYLFKMYPTARDEYPFVSSGSVITNFKGHIGKNINLNFIFLNNSNDIIYKYDNLAPNAVDWPTRETYHVSYIETKFDFEELKFIYDWQDDTIKTIYKAKEEIFLWGEEYKANKTPNYNPISNGRIIDMQYLDTDFLSKFSENNNKLTVSNIFPHHDADYLNRYINKDTKDSVLEDELLLSVSNDLYNLALHAKRIYKYKQRGFTIVDSRPVIGSILNNVHKVQQALYKDETLEEIIRGSIFSTQSKTGLLTIQKYNKLKKAYEAFDSEQTQ